MSASDPWKHLKSFTDARIALGRAGGSLPTDQMLRFRRDHALAKDAVWAELDLESLVSQLMTLSLDTIPLRSQAADRSAYIKRPDRGRKLHPDSVADLKKPGKKGFDISITIADGLSALAIEKHALPFLEHFLHLMKGYELAPVTIVKQGRVAVSDQIGELLGSKVSIILIGERPGLSSPDSMGIYLTYNPKEGNTDERRNCISNIRKEGLSYPFAAQKLSFLVSESVRMKLSGVELKDTFDSQVID